MARETVRVRGYREFLKACAVMPPAVRKEVRAALRDVGEKVRAESEQKTADRLSSAKSAAGYRVVVRQRGISVEQSLRKTTGNRGDWGVSQMRHSLVPSLEDNKDDTTERMEKAMQEVVDFFTLVARWQGEGLTGPL